MKKIEYKRWALLNSKGFSLVEVMVTTLLFSVLMGGILVTLNVGQESWETNKVKMELHQQLRQSMEWMKDDLRQAGSSSITNVPADGVPCNTITFKTPSGVSSGSIAWNASTIQFLRGGTGNLVLQRIAGGVTKSIAQNIQTLQFRRQAASSNILEVTMIAQKNTVKRKTITYQLNFQLELRNS